MVLKEFRGILKLWNLLEKNNVPTFIFINKMDRAGYDKERIIKDIHRELSKDIFFILKKI